MITILIVEDDEAVCMLTRIHLSPFYEIEEVADGEEALAVMEHKHIDLMIVDIQMPRMNGYEFVREIRNSKDMTPVIMLTAMNVFSHKKEGFASGIDDYMKKPINYEELTWRIEAILRRARIANEKKIQIGRFSMEQNTYLAQYDGQNVPLTNKEFSLLYKLLSYPGEVFTKQQLMDDIWGYDSETEYDTIKTYISRLRNKFSSCGEFELIAIRGLGYKAVIHETGGER